ncbi:hypothetical protein [Pseudomonas mandelii]|uniref:hypothetical protein n=1 Tax=Pseudomonas mandelii TaxID=75612 RepID=UPI00224A6124|nr:hypothetical protein [Pseudomonas mandelii]MCX2900425.1 hypothetical protein [Pseudomonas mandelii]
MKARYVYLFWGGMDLIFIAWVCVSNFLDGKIPLYSDIQSYVRLSAEQEWVGGVLLSLSIVLNISIVISMVVFFRCMKQARYLVCVQTPFRLLLVVPSLPFIPMLVKYGEVTSVTILLGLLVFSEATKLVSIFMVHKSQPC